MLSLILVTWPKWVHKHFQEVAEEVLSWVKLTYFSWIFNRKKIYNTDFEHEVDSKVCNHFNQLHG